MAQLIDIRRVEIGPKYLTARVRISTQAPLMTSEDLEGTTRVYRLLPHIIEHVCLGDGGDTFKDVMGDTEIAHLLEHVTVEILAQSNIAGDIPCGRTYEVDDEPRTYDIEFPCPDDALVLGALSSAAWIMQWAFTGGGEPAPDVLATVNGLVDLVESLPEPPLAPLSVRKYVVEGDEARAILAELAGEEAPQVAPAYVQDDVQLDDSQVLGVPEWLDSIDEPDESVEPVEAPVEAAVDEPADASVYEAADAPIDETVDEPAVESDDAAVDEVTDAPVAEVAEEVAEVEKDTAEADDAMIEPADEDVEAVEEAVGADADDAVEEVVEAEPIAEASDEAEDDSVAEAEAEEDVPEEAEPEVIEPDEAVSEVVESEADAAEVVESEDDAVEAVELEVETESVDEVTYEDEPIEVSLTEPSDEPELEDEPTEPEAAEVIEDETVDAEPEAELVESVESVESAEVESAPVEDAPLPDLNEPIIELDPVAATFDFDPEPEFAHRATARRIIDDVIEVAPVEVAYTPEYDPEDESFDDLGSTMVTRPLVIDPVTGKATHQAASSQANTTPEDPEDFGFDADMPTPKTVR